MTTDLEAPTAPEPTPEPPRTERLPEDHPAAKALAKANKEAEALRLKLQDLEDRDKSELQKLQDALSEKDAQLADLPRAVRSQVLRFASDASQRGFLDPEDALAFMPNDIDMSDGDAVKAALDELAARKPHLVKAQPKKPTERPKPKGGERTSTDTDGPSGKERAAAALRQFRNT